MNYLNTLVTNKLILYQKRLKYIINDVSYVTTYNYGFKNPYNQHKCYFGCCYSTCNYHPSKKNNYIFHMLNTYQLQPNYLNNKLNESLWINIVKARELFKIAGMFTMHDNYYQSINNSLTLNGLPVNFVHLNPVNFQSTHDKCFKITFSFNLTTYSKMLLYVINCRRRRLKYILFAYLPMEIIKHILYLTSIMI